MISIFSPIAFDVYIIHANPLIIVIDYLRACPFKSLKVKELCLKIESYLIDFISQILVGI